MRAKKRLFGLIWRQMSTNLNPSNLPQHTVLDWSLRANCSPSPLSLSVRLFPLSLLRAPSCVMWHTQSLILKHQADFTTSFLVSLQVFSSLSSPLLSSRSSLSLLKKDERRDEPPFMAGPSLRSWNVPLVDGRHVWRVCCRIFSGLLFVTSGSAVIDYEIQRRAFGRHTSPLACYLTTIDFLGSCVHCCIKWAPSSPWYKVLLTTVSLVLSFHPPRLFLLFLLSLLLALSPFSSLLPPLYGGSVDVLPLCNVLCIKSSLSLTPAVDRSEGWETRCNAIFSFVLTGGIFYHEDEFLRGDGSQGKYHHSGLF